MSLRELLWEVAETYPAYLRAGKPDPDDPKSVSRTVGTHPAYQLITKRLPQEVAKIVGDARPYKPKGSTGQGNAIPAPWIAVFDRAVTTSAQEGFYVVYLFSVDLRRVYASLATGVWQFSDTYGNTALMLKELDRATKKMADLIELGPRFVSGRINLAAEKGMSLHRRYSHSNIAARKYDLFDLPADAVLKKDLYALLDLYEDLRSKDAEEILEYLAVSNATAVSTDPVKVIDFVPRKPPKKGAGKSAGKSQGNPRKGSRQSKKIGDAGEKVVRDYERQRLIDAGRPNLAKKVRWLARDGERPGYDILSFNEEDDTERWIEVKTTTRDKISSVTLTEHEREVAESAPPNRFWLYVVTKVFRKIPCVETIPDLCRTLTWDDGNPRPETWTLHLS